MTPQEQMSLPCIVELDLIKIQGKTVLLGRQGYHECVNIDVRNIHNALAYLEADETSHVSLACALVVAVRIVVSHGKVDYVIRDLLGGVIISHLSGRVVAKFAVVTLKLKERGRGIRPQRK